MRVAFSFFNDVEDEDADFIFENFCEISKAHLEHTFIFITNKNSSKFIFSENVIPVSIDFKLNGFIRRLILMNLKIPPILKKYKADIFVAEKFCSLVTKVPQILVNPDLSFIQQPSFFNKNQKIFYKIFTPKFINKAASIIVFSKFAKTEIIHQYQTEAKKIEVIYDAIIKNHEPVNWERREAIKEKYADGNEYFLYAGIIGEENNLIDLLKAFSLFKKRQRSSMQLIFAGKAGKNYEKFIKSLNLFKFKKEIKVIENLSSEKKAEISSAAYAMINPSIFESNANAEVNSIKLDVPVLISSKGVLQEICGEASINFDGTNPADIAEKMMLIFKDEQLRKQLIEKGNGLLKKINAEKSLFAVIENIGVGNINEVFSKPQ